MKFWDAKEIRIIMMILATAYIWMLISCGQENANTQDRRQGSTHYARNAVVKNKDGSIVVQNKDGSLSTKTASSAKSDQAPQKNVVAALTVPADIQLSFALKLNCGESKNALCQKDSDFQKSLAEKVQGQADWAETSGDNGYNEFSQVQGLTLSFSDLIKDRIDTLKESQANDIQQIQPIINLEIDQNDGKTLHCKVLDDRAISSPSVAAEKFSLSIADSENAQSMVHTYNDSIAQTVSQVKSSYFSLKKSTQTLNCEAVNVGDLTNADNLKSYQKLVSSIMNLTFALHEDARKPASLEWTLSGVLKNESWKFKSARLHKVISEKDSYMVLELFNLDIAQNQICKVVFPSNVSKIEIKIPLEKQIVQSRVELVPLTDDAEILTSERSLSSKEFYYELRINKDELNDLSRNNIAGSLQMQNSHGTDLQGVFTARICE